MMSNDFEGGSNKDIIMRATQGKNHFIFLGGVSTDAWDVAWTNLDEETGETRVWITINIEWLSELHEMALACAQNIFDSLVAFLDVDDEEVFFKFAMGELFSDWASDLKVRMLVSVADYISSQYLLGEVSDENVSLDDVLSMILSKP